MNVGERGVSNLPAWMSLTSSDSTDSTSNFPVDSVLGRLYSKTGSGNNDLESSGSSSGISSGLAPKRMMKLPPPKKVTDDVSEYKNSEFDDAIQFP